MVGWIPRLAWSAVILLPTGMICGPWPHVFPLWPQGQSWSSSSYFHCCHSLTDLILSSKILQIHDSLSPGLTSFPVSTMCKARFREVSTALPAVALRPGLDLPYFQPCFCPFLDLPSCTNSHSPFLSGTNHILPPHPRTRLSSALQIPRDNHCHQAVAFVS